MLWGVMQIRKQAKQVFSGSSPITNRKAQYSSQYFLLMGFSLAQQILPSTLKTPLIGGVFSVIEKKKLLLRILAMLKFDHNNYVVNAISLSIRFTNSFLTIPSVPGRKLGY